jgi:hypothetical protein
MTRPDSMSELWKDPIAMVTHSMGGEPFDFQKRVSVDYDWNQNLWELVMDWHNAEQNPDADPEELEYCREQAALLLGGAVAAKNSTLFRTMADILDKLPKGTLKDVDRVKILISHDLTPLRFVVKARALLETDQAYRRLAGAPRSVLLKKNVRLLAERLWAIARLVARGKMSSLSDRNPAKTEKLIQAEIENLPRQDWTELYQKAGSKNLVNARAGRPAKKKRKS